MWESPITTAQIEQERNAAAQEFGDAQLIVFAVTKINRKLPLFAKQGDSKGASVRWASLVSQFLHEVEQRIFRGFELNADDSLEFNFSSLPAPNCASVFFEKSRRFSGVTAQVG